MTKKYVEEDDESLRRRDLLDRARRGDPEAAALLLTEYHVVVTPAPELETGEPSSTA